MCTKPGLLAAAAHIDCPTAWAVLQQARLHHSNWLQACQSESLLGRRPAMGEAPDCRMGYGPWPRTVAYAFGTGRRDGMWKTPHPEWHSAATWFASSLVVRPDYRAARAHHDIRLAALAQRQSWRYGIIVAPLLPISSMHSWPVGKRWDDARWVALLSLHNGPYDTSPEIFK